MIDSIQQFFRQAFDDQKTASSRRAGVSLELAAAALLCEVMRADYHQDDAETDLLRDTLSKRFKLSESAVADLMQLAQSKVESSVDHYQFVSLLNDHYSRDERYTLVVAMWRLAYADGELAPLEEHRIRRISALLHLSHSDFIRAKLQVVNARCAGVPGVG
ncbi:TerB family tellurite resistance protein [Halomonas halocynthiae]|uniref:tellurite resistance TerB family protein n=1 Tax=Halomonas halocynthiae TaxID=176290 RepID=UPI00040C554A|nr:TerB family tellurite resistance protein [Halomonas halocynthiae]